MPTVDADICDEKLFSRIGIRRRLPCKFGDCLTTELSWTGLGNPLEPSATAGDQQGLSPDFVFRLKRRILGRKHCSDGLVELRGLERQARNRAKVASFRCFHRLAPVVRQLCSEVLGRAWRGIWRHHLL